MTFSFKRKNIFSGSLKVKAHLVPILFGPTLSISLGNSIQSDNQQGYILVDSILGTNCIFPLQISVY